MYQVHDTRSLLYCMEMRRNVLRVGRAALSVFLSNDFLWLHHHMAETRWKSCFVIYNLFVCGDQTGEYGVNTNQLVVVIDRETAGQF